MPTIRQTQHVSYQNSLYSLILVQIFLNSYSPSQFTIVILHKQHTVNLHLLKIIKMYTKLWCRWRNWLLMKLTRQRKGFGLQSQPGLCSDHRRLLKVKWALWASGSWHGKRGQQYMLHGLTGNMKGNAYETVSTERRTEKMLNKRYFL